jgi:hypothetical protein
MPLIVILRFFFLPKEKDPAGTKANTLFLAWRKTRARQKTKRTKTATSVGITCFKSFGFFTCAEDRKIKDPNTNSENKTLKQ